QFDPDAWIRLTTFEGAERPNPALDTRGKVRFKLTNRSEFSQGEVGVCIGIRETGVAVAQLEDGGTLGPIEWVGVDTTVNAITAGPDGIVDTEAAPDDVQEYPVGFDIAGAGLPLATAVISPGINGQIDTTPTPDDEDRLGFFLAADGSRTPIPVITLPTNGSPNPAFWELEWDLATGIVSVGGVPQGGGIAPFTGNGILDPANDRGTLEHVAITNLTGDPAVFIDFAIDELQFEATVPDPVPPPTIITPIFEGDVEVQVQCTVGATEAELYVNEASIGTAVPDVGDGIATFVPPDLPALFAGDILKATQTKDGLTSDFSLPVVVFAQGVVLADNFDTYATQADLNAFWSDSIANPSPPDAKLLLQPGGAASCPNFLREQNPSSSNAARLYRALGGVNGSNGEPLRVTWNFRYTGDPGDNARTRFELAHFNGSTFSVGARGEGTAGITTFNQLAGDLLTQYNLVLRVTDNLVLYDELVAAGWVDAAGFLRHPSGVTRVPDVWHEMRIEVLTDVIDYYIDDVKVNPVAYASGVPRPNNTIDYDYVIIGEGFSNNGPRMMYDNVSVTLGTAQHPFADPVTPAPTIAGPLFPTQDTVTLTGVELSASRVSVLANDVEVGFSTSGLADPMDIPVDPPLASGAEVTATQIVGGVLSCESVPVTVGVPAVTIADAVLVPGQTSVLVTDLEEGLASLVTVYSNDTNDIGSVPDPVDDPLNVGTNPLVFGAVITATQTMFGIEGPQSAGVQVTVPAPTVVGPLEAGSDTVPVADIHPLATDVTVYVNGIDTTVPTGGATQVDVTVALLPLDADVWATQTIADIEGDVSVTVVVTTVDTDLCQVIFLDDFDSNTSADWDVN
ncbi:MAG: hypothetical protein ACYSUI_21610, partial [Planctomycetota bacterium]